MGRARVVHPNFFLNEALFEAEARAQLPLRLAFAGLWTQADREGRFEWRPGVLKLAIMPWDAVDFTAVLDALEAAGFVRSWTHEDRRYGWIPAFRKWQKPHPREAPSRIPPPRSQAVKGPAQGEPKAGPRQEVRSKSMQNNENHDIQTSKADLGPTQGEPEDSPRQEKSAGLSGLRTLRPSDSQAFGLEDSNGPSSLRTVSPDGLTPTPDQPVPEPTPEERTAFEQRRASVRAGLQDTLAQREQS